MPEMFSAIVIDLGDQIKIDAPYNVEFITDLKNIIPYSHREWNANEKCWFVKKSYKSVVLDLLDYYFNDVINQISEDIKINQLEEEITRLKRTLNRYINSDYNILGLLPTAEKTVVKAAYRALALINHPDRGGSDEYMKKINNAYERIIKK